MRSLLNLRNSLNLRSDGSLQKMEPLRESLLAQVSMLTLTTFMDLSGLITLNSHKLVSQLLLKISSTMLKTLPDTSNSELLLSQLALSKSQKKAAISILILTDSSLLEPLMF